MRRSGRMKVGEREQPIENYGKKEQKEWLDSILPDPHPCTTGHKEEEHSVQLFSGARAAVEKITLELISRVRLTAPPVQPKFLCSLLSPVDLMSYGTSRALGFPRQPFCSHLTVQLRRFGAEVVLCPSSHVPSHRHVLHERPEVQRFRIVYDGRPTRTSSLSVLVLT